ncbi:hypothetical protein KFE94_10980 [bacterium SCSIO 12643]|nr:hypothetical protein KFE94_10980 [bacterium SCSIO 12643]
MIAQIENFFTTIFSSRDDERLNRFGEESVLRLPLERTALEQISYTNWLYGGGITKTLEEIRHTQLLEEEEQSMRFDYEDNSFCIRQTIDTKLDEFYFLFDYVKEIYLGEGYRVTDAIKESKSDLDRYIETERYVLIDSSTHHLVKLEIISEHGQPLKIVGWGYPTDDDVSHVNQPRFFKIVSEIFDKVY